MSSTTSLLGLTLPDSTDSIDPEVFNDNFEIIDELAADYIVDQGYSGSWYYRKWKSGVYECWQQAGSTKSTTATSGRRQVKSSNYPVTLKNVCAWAQGRYTSNSTARTRYVRAGSKYVDCYVSWSSGLGTQCYVFIYVVGTVS